MGEIRKSKSDKVLEVKNKISSILSTLEKHDCDSELYISNLETAKTIQELDSELFPLRSDTARGKAYNINRLINIINPEEPAYDYSVVKVYKYQYIKDKTKCLERMGTQMLISHNFARKSFEEKYKDNSYSKDFVEKRRNEMEEVIKQEQELIEKISKNPNEYDILISGYLFKVEYEQINYGIKRNIKKNKKGKEVTLEKIRLNNHLSIKKPNLIVYHPDIEEDEQRSDMEVKYLEKKGYKVAARGIFYKERNNQGKK